MNEAAQLATQLGPGAAFVALLAIWLLKNRDRVGSTLSESVTDWMKRQEQELRREKEERQAAEDRHERYRAVRELKDAQHRAWDTCILQAGGDPDLVKLCGPPPSLTPHPSEYAQPREDASR